MGRGLRGTEIRTGGSHGKKGFIYGKSGLYHQVYAGRVHTDGGAFAAADNQACLSADKGKKMAGDCSLSCNGGDSSDTVGSAYGSDFGISIVSVSVICHAPPP